MSFVLPPSYFANAAQWGIVIPKLRSLGIIHYISTVQLFMALTPVKCSNFFLYCPQRVVSRLSLLSSVLFLGVMFDL